MSHMSPSVYETEAITMSYQECFQDLTREMSVCFNSLFSHILQAGLSTLLVIVEAEID